MFERRRRWREWLDPIAVVDGDRVRFRRGSAIVAWVASVCIPCGLMLYLTTLSELPRLFGPFTVLGMGTFCTVWMMLGWRRRYRSLREGSRPNAPFRFQVSGWLLLTAGMACALSGYATDQRLKTAEIDRRNRAVEFLGDSGTLQWSLRDHLSIKITDIWYDDERFTQLLELLERDISRRQVVVLEFAPSASGQGVWHWGDMPVAGNITDLSVEAIERCLSLETLLAGRTCISREGSERLAKLPRLRAIELPYYLSDDSLQALQDRSVPVILDDGVLEELMLDYKERIEDLERLQGSSPATAD